MDQINGNGAAGGATRRGILKCMAWAGTGVLWSVAGGVPNAIGLGSGEAQAATGGFSFVQISDTHIGFKGEVNKEPGATAQLALDRIAKLPTQPAMLVHT